jgi:molybdopterin-dependent oxidoreductase alpha subunit
MLGALQSAVRKGCKIIAVNPMPEASLMGFADPQEARSYLGKQTKLAHLYLQPLINGDMALVRGMVKAILEAEETSGNILDLDFINKYTSGFQEFKQIVAATPWEDLLQACGMEKDQITEAANIYMNSKNTIATWCLGITHHKNSIETLREIINLMLLKGNIGRPGAGLCPVRGHSNIQGIRTSGSGENMPVSFLEALEKRFSVKIPRKPGLGVIDSIKAIHEGKVKVLISLGGNLASAVPDTIYTEEALQKCRLTVMVSTKLNRSHLITGKKALILPCLGRSDEDTIHGKKRFTTIEDTLGKIGFSKGCLPPLSPLMKSEVDIIAGIAMSTLRSNHIEWQKLANDYNLIREAMNEVIPAFKDIHKLKSSTRGHYIENPLRNRIFKTDNGRASFSNYPLQKVNPGPGELIMMTIRSHDQFNTSIFGLNDRYRGISNERRVLFMNSDDMSERKIQPGQLVEISSNYDDRIRKIEGYYAIPYPVKKGCVAAYFPETNILTSINHMNLLCGTPAFKSVRVLVK